MAINESKHEGHLFFIVGNSGSGKDSILSEVQKKWPEEYPPIKIPHRYITRPPHESEPYHSVNEEQFHALQNQGKFCLTWHIYDTYYGVPREILNWIQEGAFVIVNVSRSIVSQARNEFPKLKVIFVKVPYDVTVQRIKTRGREQEKDKEFQKRINRAKTHQNFSDADIIVDNSGDLQQSAQNLYQYLTNFI